MWYGPEGAQVSEAGVGFSLRTMADDARRAIRACTDRTPHPKTSYAGVSNGDVYFMADLDAQAAYEVGCQRAFPWAGLIAEEGLLRLPCNLPFQVGRDNPFFAYLTADGMCGSKAYGEKKRAGVATMGSFVYDGRVVGAVVSSVYGADTYWMMADSKVVKLERPRGTQIDLTQLPRSRPLRESRVVVRGDVGAYPPIIRQMLGQSEPPEKLRVWSLRHYSIGLSMALLWRDEVRMHLQAPGFDTPWGTTPIDGISQALGMVRLRPTLDNRALVKYQPPLVTEIVRRDHCIVTLHESRLPELRRLIPVVNS